MANAASSSPQRANITLRKTNKPLMEKRRRARINDSLSQLKSLVIQGTKKDSSQFNKLEKADILELTVKYLRSLQEQQQLQKMQPSKSTLAGKYQAGFIECANEVIRYIGHSQGFADDIKSRVIHHLADCVKLSNKQAFTKPAQQPTNQTGTTVMPNGLHAQLPNGQIIQIISTPFHKANNSNSGQITGSNTLVPASSLPATPSSHSSLPATPSSHSSLPVHSTRSSLPVHSTSTHSSLPVHSTAHPSLPVSSALTNVPVILTSNQTNISSPVESLRIRYTQPLHIQIPRVLSPLIIQSQPTKHDEQPQSQASHKILETVERGQASPQQETFVSSSTPSPHLMESSPVLTKTHQKPHLYYSHDDPFVDYIPRSRTYSLTSSVSTESELTSPLNLSQSPKYYDHIGYTNQLDNSHFPTSTRDKTSPTEHFSRCGIYQSKLTSSNFASVIVDGRKHLVDSHTLKYMNIMDDERVCFRHDGTLSPASSVGEERLWRPW